MLRFRLVKSAAYSKNMTFNHYAKLKRILADQPAGWYIRRIDEPTTTKTFRGDSVTYPHYYRLYDKRGAQIPYGKFQQLERLASVLDVPAEALPVLD